MDRSKWEVDNKTFGEVFDLFMGRTPSRDNDSYWQNGKYEWLSIGDMGETKYLSKTKEMVSEEAVANMQQVPENTVVMSFKLSIGKVGITSIPLYTNEAIMAFPPKEGYHILPTFLYYYLQAYKWQPANRAVMGKTLNKAVISNSKISIPNVEDQQRIVEELDCLNEMIAVKQEQLKEFDKLAQSIFYDMFGEPVTNEKGWEKKKLDELYKVTSSKRILQSEWQDNGVPFYKVADIVNLIGGKAVVPSTFIKESTYNDLMKLGLVPDSGDILITSRGTLGECYIVMEGDKFYFQDGMITWLSQKTNSILPIFLKSVFDTKSFLDSLLHSANMSTVAYLSIGQLSKVKIPLPPLTLQQEFAEKISAIEDQKKLVKQSIAETQRLLDYTMDKYFG